MITALEIMGLVLLGAVIAFLISAVATAAVFGIREARGKK